MNNRFWETSEHEEAQEELADLRVQVKLAADLGVDPLGTNTTGNASLLRQLLHGKQQSGIHTYN